MLAFSLHYHVVDVIATVVVVVVLAVLIVQGDNHPLQLEEPPEGLVQVIYLSALAK